MEDVDLVERVIGPKGKWQYLLCLAVTPLKISVATMLFSFVFLAPPIEFECSVATADKCSPECPSHVFNRSIFTNTITMEWDLVCDKSQMANVAQTTFVLGLLVGSILFGYVADKFGRRKTLIWASVIQGAAGAAVSFAPWFWLFVALRFVTATAVSGNITVNFIYIMEITGRKWRVFIGTVMQISTNIGFALIACWAYFIRDWRSLQLGISTPMICTIGYLWFLPESPRWLLSTGRIQEAVATLEKAARLNGLPTAAIPEYVKEYQRDTDEPKTGSTMDLFRTPNIRMRSACIFFNWLVCGLCFYGEAQFMGQIGNIFVNIAVPNIIQIPVDFSAVFFMDKFGRKFSIIMFYVISSVCLLTIAFLPRAMVTAVSILGGIGYMSASVCFSIMFYFTGELYPTVIRNVGSGYASMFARVGSMVAPFIASLSTLEFWLTPLIFGVLPLVAAMTCFRMPETKRCKLPDTVEEAENYGAKKNSTKDLENYI